MMRLPAGHGGRFLKDPELNRLETLLAENNPDLQVQAEIFTQARDVAREAEAQLYPQAGATGGMSNNRASPDAVVCARNPVPHPSTCPTSSIWLPRRGSRIFFESDP